MSRSLMKSISYWLLAMLPLVLILCASEWYLREQTKQRLHEKLEKNASLRKGVLIHEKSDDPVLIYQLKPHGLAHQHGVTYQINAQGFRDEDFNAIANEPGVKKILVLGDSVAWGWGVEMAEAWPQRLESMLAGQQYVIFNMAVNGYNTPQELRILEKYGLFYRPDQIILHYVLNDAEQEDGGLGWYFKDVDRFELKLQTQMLWGFLKILAKQQWHKAFDQKVLGPSKTTLSKAEINIEVDSRDHYFLTHEAYWPQIEENFQKLKEITEAEHIPVTVIITPVFDFEVQAPYPWFQLHKKIEQLSLSKGFSFIDTLPALINKNSSEESLDSIHPNALGHEIIAETIYQKLFAPK